MINVDRVYQQTQVLLNKYQRGYISPSEFNLTLNKAVKKIYETLLTEYRKLNYKKIRGATGANYSQESEYYKQLIEHYLEIKEVNGDFELPTTASFIHSLSLSDGTEVEKVTNKEFNIYRSTKTGTPTNCYPIYTLYSRKVKTIPLQSKMELSYIRTPKVAKWTYQEIDGEPMYDSTSPDASDVDIPESMESQLINELLILNGLHLRDGDVVQAGLNETSSDYQRDQQA